MVSASVSRASHGEYEQQCTMVLQDASNEPGQLATEKLARRCAQETQRFFNQLPHNTQYCYELFRRAVEEQNQAAWTAIYDAYGPLAGKWVRTHPCFASVGNDPATYVNCAFANLWRKLTESGRFRQFSDVGDILAYLKACARSCVRDEYRKIERRTMDVALENADMQPAQANIERDVIDEDHRAQLLAKVQAHLQDEQEHRVFICIYEWDLKPREIAEMYPDHFPDVQEVYRCKRNLLERLRRDMAIQSMWKSDVDP